ncbi:MAG: glutamate--tRNA ligase [Armatimonadetes bacterium]|nr:glutamate--tRNA ligase [Armatimonadota bacterium]
MSVRVRYAPSPTGSPHVGNIRDALFKHLFAKHTGGTNILRIEDTDRTRYVPGCEEEIVESLQWIGVEYQEGFGIGGDCGPYRQSERKEAGIYAKWVQVLLESGHAYKAFDTSQELEEMREFQKINKQPIGYYGGLWRDASGVQVEEAERAGKPAVIRLKIPRGKTIVIEDFIRGRLEFDSDTVDDPVLIKADGMPTYHFAAMVDDHLMDITHIMRGEEWISSAPKHAWLFDAYGWEKPVFVHCPVIKGKDGSKLSKRHGDTRCLDYRAAGYLPEALANFIALIGWSPGGDRELMTMDELCEAFSLEGLQPSPGVFDLDKLRWMNGHYIRATEAPELVSKVREYAQAGEYKPYFEKEDHASPETIAALELLAGGFKSTPDIAGEAVRLEQERVTTLADFGEACAFFLQEEPPFDPKAVEKWFGQPHVPALIDHLIAALDGRSAITHDECETLVKEYAASAGMEKLGPAVHPTRVALTGKTVGPGLWDLMAVLGPAKMIQRLTRAKAMLG